MFKRYWRARVRYLLLLLIGITIFSTGCLHALGVEEEVFELSAEEKTMLASYQGRTLTLGLDPNVGIEYFTDGDAVHGFMLPLIELVQQRLGIKIKIVADRSWADVFSGLHSGEIDLLLGANVTPERLETMAFTSPVYSVPYTVLALKNSGIHTIGDLHKKRIGFIEEDIGLEAFERLYNKISFEPKRYADQEAAFKGLISGEVSGFITSGGDVVYDYLYQFPNIAEIARLERVRSDLTLSATKANAELVQVLQRLIHYEKPALDQMIFKERQFYLRKIIRLTPEEKQWLETSPKIRVGVATDYLPIDYYADGAYKGIAGHYLTTFANLIGIQLEAVPGTFDEVYRKALKGEVDVLNMAKTEERQANFLFTNAFSDERDQIYGLRSQPYIYDTYGLEGKKVAVIEGFWHEQFLLRNLTDVEIVRVKDIQSALNALVLRKADYFIETPAVAEYYIVGLGYTNVIKKGETSAESFLYFGAQKQIPEFISLFNKMQSLIRYDESKYIGSQGVPQQTNVANRRLALLLLLAVFGLLLLVMIVINVVRKLSRQSSEMLLLKERERLIYLDPLTQLYNRNYFNRLEATMDSEPFPQHIIMMDLNDLKLVNDEFGHLAGDALICQFASILKQIEQKGIAIRMGGDEFVLWLTGMQESEVQSTIQRLRMRCHQTRVPNPSDETQVIIEGIVVSIGYGVREQVGKTVEQCLKDADAAMYQDKFHLKFQSKGTSV